MSQQDEQVHGQKNQSSESDAQSAQTAQVLWETYASTQNRSQRLARPVVVLLGLAVVALLGVALWIVAIL